MSKSLVETIDSNPLAVRAYDFLWKMGKIFPGSIVLREDIERALEMPYEDNWTFLGKFLCLQLKIKSEGFFINQKKLTPPSFRIVKSEDMAEIGTKRIMEAVSYNYETAYIMAAHDISRLDENQQKKHKKVQQKAAQSALLQQKVLLDNSFF
jgi:hypothetical protein